MVSEAVRHLGRSLPSLSVQLISLKRVGNNQTIKMFRVFLYRCPAGFVSNSEAVCVDVEGTVTR